LEQRVLHSTLAQCPIIGDQLQSNIHGLRANTVGLIVGLAGFMWGARGYLISHNLKHASQVYGFFAIVLGLLSCSVPEAYGHAAPCSPPHPVRQTGPDRSGQARGTPP